ncbi:MFS transporter [Actinoplanes sp. N902-109]|uniref:MFS transporter n=1 Tax=Actinoplanes sp. (strain N902-109) TaxID=649831 RepID=UPI0003293635|nr:MFS transporter [Actinoplanes sp. N902-109]AGL17246.1 MFS transporter methylenomycin A resistance protein [Actinoplanes sp. N902-109]
MLLGLSLGYFLVLLDLTAVAVALPDIAAALHTDVAGLQWVSNGYTLTFAAFLLPAGRLADRYGGRRVFLAGLLAFGVLSAGSAAATGLAVLVVLRLALGVAGALLLPSSLAVITTAYPDPARRARAVGAWAAITGVALAAGPVAGGLLTGLAGWRAIFLVNVPLVLLALVLTRRSAPATGPVPTRRGSADVLGQAAAVVALAAVTWALIEGEPAGYVVAVVAAAVLVAAEVRAGDAALLPPRLFRDRAFPAALLAGLLANFGLSGLLFVLSLFLQNSRGYPALTAGLAFLPLTIPPVVNPVLTGRLAGRIGSRVPAVIGFLLMAPGALVLAASAANPVVRAGALLLFGTGVSFTLPALVVGVAATVPAELAGIGGGALNSARQVGAALGVAVLGSMLAAAPTTAAGTRTALGVTGLVLLAGAVVAGAGLGERPVSRRRRPRAGRVR